MLHLSSSSSSSSFPTKPTMRSNIFHKAQRVMTLFKQCTTMKEVKQLHAHITHTGLDQTLCVLGKVISFCAVSDLGDMDYAVSVFSSIESPDGFLWNTMIRGFGKTDKPERAFEFCKRMQEKGNVADNFTLSFLLKVSGQLGSDILGKQIHCTTVKNGFDSNVFVRNTLIHMYGMFGDAKTALHLFDEMPSPDLVAWNTIIDSHVNCGKCNEALDLFLRMMDRGVDTDEATVVVTLSACSTLGALDFGRWVHCLVDHTDLGNVVTVSNSLIDMYAKCGAVEEAYDAFNKMKGKKNIVSWNTMILGLATHGHADKSLDLFLKMLEEKLERPDGVTFLGVLCACSYGGMVDEGRRYFEIMSKDYQIQPTVKHYGCMVDMLGRAGFVEEAYRLIRSMPVKCNAIVWRTLLSACQVHGEVELGEKVRSHLLELASDHSSDYVLLANMYASLGQWNEAMRVRRSMQYRGVEKPEPGNSLVGADLHMKLKMDSTEAYSEDINAAVTSS
ncbi:putative tetratricopeptide-like helical domain-containing protein [Rosa chinensis]|uniref:Putative tetratricopeptide-like helical domain-containing protein n=1 Tax=Rosa chinensis TaxID=74649 RepID=A0A2P6P2R4_ROSCH|nr:pentatricopeptide repeat-containing protein At4g21065 [Rosa chinensis]PRQ16209.1 putative tetratricopeptide-like helical domain-containing protein [Rosa chinensis]